MERLLRWFLAPAHSGLALALLIAAYYGGMAAFNPEVGELVHRQLMVELSIVSALCILAGWWLTPARDHQVVLPRDHRRISGTIGVLFALFVLFTTATAPTIPLLGALSGQDVQDIAVGRENFLKAREGIFAVLPYLNGMLTFSFLPYAMCLAFVTRNSIAWVLVALFFGYSLLFVEKAFFIRVLAPLAALMIVSRYRKLRLSWLLTGAFGLLALNIQLSGFANEDRDIFEFFLYRLLEVPAQTAIDSIAFWEETWKGQYLLGATNLLFSNLFFLDRIHLERLVFEYQFGAFETGTGSANSVFFIDAYVNFGLVGVVVASVLVGVVMRLIGRSADPAMRCLAPLLLYSVFFASFFSVLFGNGLLLFLLLKPMLPHRRCLGCLATGSRSGRSRMVPADPGPRPAADATIPQAAGAQATS